MRRDCLLKFLEFPQPWAHNTFIALARRLCDLNDGHPEIDNEPYRYGRNRSQPYLRQSAFICGWDLFLDRSSVEASVLYAL